MTSNTSSLCCCLITQSCASLCNPMDHSPPAPLSMGFLKQEYWNVLPFPPPGDLPNTGIKPASFVFPVLAAGFFTTSATCQTDSLNSFHHPPWIPGSRKGIWATYHTYYDFFFHLENETEDCFSPTEEWKIYNPGLAGWSNSKKPIGDRFLSANYLTSPREWLIFSVCYTILLSVSH